MFLLTILLYILLHWVGVYTGIYDWGSRKKALYILYQNNIIPFFYSSSQPIDIQKLLLASVTYVLNSKHSHRPPSPKTKRHRTHQPNPLGHRQHTHPPRLPLDPLTGPQTSQNTRNTTRQRPQTLHQHTHSTTSRPNLPPPFLHPTLPLLLRLIVFPREIEKGT
jgi:hypothetical protein